MKRSGNRSKEHAWGFAHRYLKIAHNCKSNILGRSFALPRIITRFFLFRDPHPAVVRRAEEHNHGAQSETCLRRMTLKRLATAKPDVSSREDYEDVLVRALDEYQNTTSQEFAPLVQPYLTIAHNCNSNILGRRRSMAKTFCSSTMVLPIGSSASARSKLRNWSVKALYGRSFSSGSLIVPPAIFDPINLQRSDDAADFLPDFFLPKEETKMYAQPKTF